MKTVQSISLLWVSAEVLSVILALNAVSVLFRFHKNRLVRGNTGVHSVHSAKCL